MSATSMRGLLLGTCAVAFVVLGATLWSSKGSGSTSMRRLLDTSKLPLTPGFEECDRTPNNRALATFVENALSKVRRNGLFCGPVMSQQVSEPMLCSKSTTEAGTRPCQEPCPLCVLTKLGNTQGKASCLILKTVSMSIAWSCLCTAF